MCLHHPRVRLFASKYCTAKYIVIRIMDLCGQGYLWTHGKRNIYRRIFLVFLQPYRLTKTLPSGQPHCCIPPSMDRHSPVICVTSQYGDLPKLVFTTCEAKTHTVWDWARADLGYIGEVREWAILLKILS